MTARHRTPLLSALLVVALSLSACSSAPAGPDVDTAEAWQTRVVAIAELAAAGDPASGLQELAALEAEALSAREAGEISAERAAQIQEAIVLVRADLEAAATTPTPVVTTEPTTPAGDDTGDKGNSGTKDRPGEKGNKGKGKTKAP
ncbi:hypothetical protein [Microbacterium sp.]|uniref:hypothetical protein n=1 Tax=Microbacterium sp. TaxID=51671 RepID=UPI003F7287C7